MKIFTLDSVDSTNTYLKKQIESGGRADIAVTAVTQTGGRGRCGNTFYSAPGGTYFSFAMPYPKDDPFLTPSVAVAVCRVLSSISANARIKWVNDIIVDGRKAGGILCERVFSPSGRSFVVIGVGINTGITCFPSELIDVACSIKSDVSPKELAYAIIDETKIICEKGLDTDEYRRLSVLVGRTVSFRMNGKNHTGFVSGIDEKCGLIIDSGDCSTVLRSGEVYEIRPS